MLLSLTPLTFVLSFCSVGTDQNNRDICNHSEEKPEIGKIAVCYEIKNFNLFTHEKENLAFTLTLRSLPLWAFHHEKNLLLE
jgi:hypothetical protein